MQGHWNKYDFEAARHRQLLQRQKREGFLHCSVEKPRCSSQLISKKKLEYVVASDVQYFDQYCIFVNMFFFYNKGPNILITHCHKCLVYSISIINLSKHSYIFDHTTSTENTPTAIAFSQTYMRYVILRTVDSNVG